MTLDKLQGFEELERDAEAIQRRFLQRLDPKKRLEGLGPKDVLQALGPQEQEELLALLLARREQRRG